MVEQAKLNAFMRGGKVGKIEEERGGAQKPYDLSEGLKWVKLSEICKINPSQSEIRALPDDLQVTFVPMVAVSEITGRIEKPMVRLLGDVRKGYTYFIEGDVLFAKITPCMENGKSAIARNLVNRIGFGSTEFHILRPTREVLPEWIHFYIRQKHFRDEAARNMTGSVGQQRVPVQFLKRVKIPLPPLEEQKRIVARLEGLVGRAEEAKRLRRIAREEAEKIMQAALHKVFSRCEEEGWERIKLGSILKLANGKFITKKQLKSEGEEPYNIPVYGSNGIIGYTTNVLIEFDTLTIGRVGACGAINLAKGPCWISDNAMYIKEIDFGKTSLGFLYWLLKMYSLEKFTKISAQPSISQVPIKNLRIPLPSPEEQKKMVEYLNRVRETAESLKKLQQGTEEELEEVVPAILDKAFRGEL